MTALQRSLTVSATVKSFARAHRSYHDHWGAYEDRDCHD